MPPERTAGATLDLRNVVKRYGNAVAVDKVSLHVRSGEFITLLGPSGSGKTTTLNLIAGFAELSSGSIHMDERPIDDLPPHRRNIGMVFQNYALFPHMTAAENVAFPLKQRRVSKADVRHRVEQALALVHLQELAGRYPHELSGGQQQRVALARAIVFEPRALLLDEPLGALDKKLRESLQLEIRRIHRDVGITFIFVTHDQDEAIVLSDRIAVFNGGVIEQVGTAEELYERPQSRFVAQFIGESNIFDGLIASEGNQAVVRRQGYAVYAAASVEQPLGASGAIAVRPERVRLLTGPPEELKDHNVFDATIREVIYLGNARRIEAELPDGATATIREAASSPTTVAEGQRVRIAWRVEDSILLADQSGSETNGIPPGVDIKPEGISSATNRG